MRSPAPSAERIASMTVSTAVAAFARGIWARSTTRSTMSALIIGPPGYPELYNLLFLQSDGRRQGRRRGPCQLPGIGQVGRGGARTSGALRQEKRHGLIAHEDRLDQAFRRNSAQCPGQVGMPRQGRQRPQVEGA